MIIISIDIGAGKAYVVMQKDGCPFESLMVEEFKKEGFPATIIFANNDEENDEKDVRYGLEAEEMIEDEELGPKFSKLKYPLKMWFYNNEPEIEQDRHKFDKKVLLEGYLESLIDRALDKGKLEGDEKIEKIIYNYPNPAPDPSKWSDCNAVLGYSAILKESILKVFKEKLAKYLEEPVEIEGVPEAALISGMLNLGEEKKGKDKLYIDVGASTIDMALSQPKGSYYASTLLGGSTIDRALVSKNRVSAKLSNATFRKHKAWLYDTDKDTIPIPAVVSKETLKREVLEDNALKTALGQFKAMLSDLKGKAQEGYEIVLAGGSSGIGPFIDAIREVCGRQTTKKISELYEGVTNANFMAVAGIVWSNKKPLKPRTRRTGFLAPQKRMVPYTYVISLIGARYYIINTPNPDVPVAEYYASPSRFHTLDGDTTITEAEYKKLNDTEKRAYDSFLDYAEKVDGEEKYAKWADHFGPCTIYVGTLKNGSDLKENTVKAMDINKYFEGDLEELRRESAAYNAITQNLPKDEYRICIKINDSGPFDVYYYNQENKCFYDKESQTEITWKHFEEKLTKENRKKLSK